MRTYVSFQHPAEFVPVSKEDGIGAVGGAQWFVSLLQRVPGLQLDKGLCQEDWGVVAFARRNEKRFWIGLSMWPDGEHAWLAHVHHGSFAWLQRITPSGKKEMRQLLTDIHDVLASELAVSAITWYEESEMGKAHPQGSQQQRS